MAFTDNAELITRPCARPTAKTGFALRCHRLGDGLSERKGIALFNLKIPEAKAVVIIDHLDASMKPNLKRIVSILKVLSDERRLRILKLLMRRELCVCELVDTLLLPQYEVSRHLALLKNIGLVVDRRQGLWAYYSIPEGIRVEPFVGELLKLLDQHIASVGEIPHDFTRLERRLALRVGGRCVVGFQA